MLRFLLRSLVLLFLPLTGMAQPVFFEKIYGTHANEQARSLTQLGDGSIYVLGFSDSGSYGAMDVALSKLDQYGNLRWIKYYGDSDDNFGLWMNKTSDGKLVICGENQRGGNQVDAYAMKLDTGGNIIWAKNYATALNESFKYIEQTANGGFVLCGFRNDSYGYNDTYVMRTNSTGDSLWSVMIGGNNNDYSDMVHELSDGSFLVTGDTKSMGAGGYDVELTHLDASGQLLWDYPYGDPYNNGCQGVFLNSSGKYLSYGETEINNFSFFDFYFEMIDAAGNSLWRDTFGGPNADACFSVVEMPDKGYIGAGYSNSFNTGPLNLAVFRTDSMAQVQWVRSYGGPGIDIGYQVIHAIDGGVLVAGSTVDSLTFDGQFYLLHLDDAGLLSGVEVQEGPSSGPLIYPNPCQGSFKVKWAGWKPGSTLTIWSSDGKQVYNGPLIANNSWISLEQNCANGVYFVEVNNGRSLCHSKLMLCRNR